MMVTIICRQIRKIKGTVIKKNVVVGVIMLGAESVAVILITHRL